MIATQPESDATASTNKDIVIDAHPVIDQSAKQSRLLTKGEYSLNLSDERQIAIINQLPTKRGDFYVYNAHQYAKAEGTYMQTTSVPKGSLSEATQVNDPEDHLCETQ